MKKPHVTRTTDINEYETPPELFNKLNQIVGFDIDLAASAENSLCDDFCDDLLTVEGLDKSAGLIGWLNPPFNNKEKLIRFCLLELRQIFREIWLLIPNNARETEFWQTYVWPEADEIISLSPRLNFLLNGERPVKKNKDGSIYYNEKGETEHSGAGFSCCLVVYRRRIPGVWYGSPKESIWNWKE